MELQLPRAARLPSGTAVPTFLTDPETGQPVVFASSVIGTPGTALNAILFDIELTGVQTLLVQLTGTWVGSVAFEGTIDGTAWFSVAGYRPDSAGSPAAISAGSNVVVAFPAVAKRIRARVSAYTSGTVNSAAFLTDVPAVAIANVSPLPAGSNLVGSINLSPRVSGGTTGVRVTGASGVLKAGAGSLYAYDLMNTNAAARYLQVYAKATAGVPGTDTPVRTIGIPAGQAKTWENTQGVSIATGMSYAITTDAAGATLAAAGDIVGTFDYA